MEGWVYINVCMVKGVDKYGARCTVASGGLGNYWVMGRGRYGRRGNGKGGLMKSGRRVKKRNTLEMGK